MQTQPTTLLSHASMDNRRKKSSSGDSFSFPSTPNPDSDFEFGCLTPDSPSSDPCRTSPADHLFFNGRLLPHSFPTFQQHHAAVFDNPRCAASRTSSIGSKDSLVSSRSNSTNSSCSSARTSSSDSSERRLFHSKVAKDRYQGSRMASVHQAYGCSQRWQYITPVPALSRDASRRRRVDRHQARKEGEKTKMQAARVRSRLRFGRRLFRWFVMACKECHAMEPSKANKETMLQENVNT